MRSIEDTCHSNRAVHCQNFVQVPKLRASTGGNKQMRFLLCILVMICAGCAAPPPRDVGMGFSFLSSIKYTSGRGLRGNRMRVRLTARCNGPWEVHSVRIISGDIPTGIFFDGVEFSGTPRNAGSSFIQAKVMGPACNGIVYEDKVVWLTFDIVGDGPRF